ncbi:hypothetical protein GCM10007972_01330 [Iodidimonas muriae]|uniref:Cytochrome c n=1 Tax=Iodidimonas muriae TaxID=261467 RepID=A0ABQ2L645_9PROT|nr:aldehyde dehydrogenase [Iodidimonas muriae]GER06421.1 hypothetical protein JCM17843_07310 [Kordiimonadales bacterium JCM 17843]GGO04697.1 hypothetical protein GCM10007972_01330 [Iodidimonas muriae]
MKLLIIGLWACFFAAAPASAQEPQKTDDEMDMPPDMAAMVAGEGRETSYYLCSGCHSTKLVTQQRLSRDRWAYLLDWMTKEQGMAELDAESRTIILDYLSTAYGPSTTQRKTQRR